MKDESSFSDPTIDRWHLLFQLIVLFVVLFKADF